MESHLDNEASRLNPNVGKQKERATTLNEPAAARIPVEVAEQ